MVFQELEMTERFSGTRDVAEGHRFDAGRLERYLADRIPGFAGPLEVRQFRGGQSNPTYQLSSPSGRWVLRRKPPGKLLRSAHAVDREFRVISALNRVEFPVPRAFVLCEDEAVIGTVFYVMEFVEGRVIWDPLLPELASAERRALYDSMNETLAVLHGVDYRALGLEDFGRPGNYFARQISRWSKQYAASVTEPIAEMDALIEWLPRNVPDDDTTCLVHGDYSLSNMIVHPTEPRVVAVLDWELSTLGHPLGDLTYQLSRHRSPDTPLAQLTDAELAERGVPTEAEYVEAYCRRTGRAEVPRLDFYFAYNFFRYAAILQGIAGRVRDGTAANQHAAAVARGVRPLAEIAWGYAQRLGASPAGPRAPT